MNVIDNNVKQQMKSWLVSHYGKSIGVHMYSWWKERTDSEKFMLNIFVMQIIIDCFLSGGDLKSIIQLAALHDSKSTIARLVGLLSNVEECQTLNKFYKNGQTKEAKVFLADENNLFIVYCRIFKRKPANLEVSKYSSGFKAFCIPLIDPEIFKKVEEKRRQLAVGENQTFSIENT